MKSARESTEGETGDRRLRLRARVETKAGLIGSARKGLCRAAALQPQLVLRRDVEPVVTRQLVALVLVGASFVPAALAAPRPLQTALILSADSAGGQRASLARFRAAGATAARMPVDWAVIAPRDRSP